MSNKNLLNENTVRRFMKLAEIEPLTNQFVNKINETEYKEDDVTETMHGKKDKFDEAAHMKDDPKGDKKDDMKEGMGPSYTDDEETDGQRDPIMEEELDGTIDEELDALLAEMELDEGGADYQDDEDEMPEDMAVMDDAPDDEDMDVEMGMEEPAMGGMDMAAMADMIKDAVMDALKDLVDGGDLEVSMEDPEEFGVDAADEEAADADGDEGDEDDEDMADDKMVNEVARRVMKRIMNSRR